MYKRQDAYYYYLNSLECSVNEFVRRLLKELTGGFVIAILLAGQNPPQLESVVQLVGGPENGQDGTDDLFLVRGVATAGCLHLQAAQAGMESGAADRLKPPFVDYRVEKNRRKRLENCTGV